MSNGLKMRETITYPSVRLTAVSDESGVGDKWVEVGELQLPYNISLSSYHFITFFHAGKTLTYLPLYQSLSGRYSPQMEPLDRYLV